MLADDETPEAMQAAGASAVERLREALLTGFAVMIPLLVTLYVLSVAAGIIVDVLRPVEQALVQFQFTASSATLLVRVMAVVVLAAVTVAVGLFATFQSGQRALAYFDTLVERVPGVGAVYKSFRQMGDVMLESDAGNFQDVRLVEFPRSETYTLGFETTETPDAIRDAAGHDGMRTLFLPLAPNPVMGGHLAHVPEERVLDVDMTVEEGIRAVVTTGVGVAQPEAAEAGLSPGELERLSGQEIATNLEGGGEADR